MRLRRFRRQRPVATTPGIEVKQTLPFERLGIEPALAGDNAG